MASVFPEHWYSVPGMEVIDPPQPSQPSFVQKRQATASSASFRIPGPVDRSTEIGCISSYFAGPSFQSSLWPWLNKSGI